MSHTFEITHEQYEQMRDVAEVEGRTVEDLFAGWVRDIEARYRERHPIFYDEDSWLRHLGATDDQIREAERLAALDDDQDSDDKDSAVGMSEGARADA